MFAMNINSTFFAIVHLSLFDNFFYSYFYLICYFITGGIQNVQCKPNVNTLMTLVCNEGSRSSSIYIYNDLLFYIIHPIFDNLFCTNIQSRQVFSECVPWYLANRKNTSWFWLILLYWVHLNNFMHIYCRRHIIYNIIKQWIYFFSWNGKGYEKYRVFSYLMCFPMSWVSVCMSCVFLCMSCVFVWISCVFVCMSCVFVCMSCVFVCDVFSYICHVFSYVCHVFSYVICFPMSFFSYECHVFSYVCHVFFVWISCVFVCMSCVFVCHVFSCEYRVFSYVCHVFSYVMCFRIYVMCFRMYVMCFRIYVVCFRMSSVLVCMSSVFLCHFFRMNVMCFCMNEWMTLYFLHWYEDLQSKIKYQNKANIYITYMKLYMNEISKFMANSQS
jgi:hypothetical protein